MKQKAWNKERRNREGVSKVLTGGVILQPFESLLPAITQDVQIRQSECGHSVPPRKFCFASEEWAHLDDMGGKSFTSTPYKLPVRTVEMHFFLLEASATLNWDVSSRHVQKGIFFSLQWSEGRRCRRACFPCKLSELTSCSAGQSFSTGETVRG